VEAGIHSRRRAANELGVEDPETEFARWLAKAYLSTARCQTGRRPGLAPGRRECLADWRRLLDSSLYLVGHRLRQGPHVSGGAAAHGHRHGHRQH